MPLDNIESLRDKLKSLGVQIGAQNILKPPLSPAAYPIESVITGENRETRFGTTFMVEKEVPMGTFHGDIDLCKIPDYHFLAQWAKSDSLCSRDYQNILFLDAETSGLAGGAGTFAFMLGLGYFTPTGFKLIQLFLPDPSQEQSFLVILDEILSQFNILVTFNGKSFDIPLLTTRFIMQRHPVPFKRKDHIDLLHLARRVWKNRLASRTLGSLETEILNLSRTQEEVPGWMVPELYNQYLKTRDARPLAGVFYHNEVDILSLAALLNLLAQMLNAPLELASSHNLDRIAIARLYEEMGHLDRAIQLYENCLGKGLPREFLIQTLHRYARIYKRARDWPAATDLWERAALRGDIEACIELAKYHEHTQREPSTALMWTERALDRLQEQKVARSHAEITQSTIEHRRQRLLGKLGAPQERGDEEN